MKNITIQVANRSHVVYAQIICELIENAAKARGTGIALRQPTYIANKIEEGKAIIALCGKSVAGFCYIETWEHDKYVANSGLVVATKFRSLGLAKNIKQAIFDLSKTKFPKASIFGITTSPAVLKINYELGYRPVTFNELTVDDEFWNGCKSCPNHDILMRTRRKYCLCTGMLASSADELKNDNQKETQSKNNISEDEEESCTSL